jgi:hypothetical protein
MPRRSKPDIQRIKQLQRESTSRLYLSLSRKAAQSARDSYITHRTYKKTGREQDLWRSPAINHMRSEPSGRIFKTFPKKAYSEPATIDSSMLKDLTSALRGKASEETGERLFRAIWRRIQKNVCDDFDLCNKWQGGDAGLTLALWNFIMRGMPMVDHGVLTIVIVLAMRMGPEWMCGCSKRKRK